MKFYNKK